jgi:hypothetical protein
VKNAAGAWVGYGVGDSDDPTLKPGDSNYQAVTLINKKLHDKYQWARDLGVVYGSVYTTVTAAAIKEFCKRTGLPLVLDANGLAVANYTDRVRLGSFPPPPPPMHAIITFNGTWGAGIVQYPGNTINGLHEYVNPFLCQEIVCPYPASFGPVPPGDISAPSYNQSIAVAIAWMGHWLEANPNRTFGLIGYSQGAEAASRILMELQGGSLSRYLPNFIGGITFGNPSRGAGFHASTIADPGGHGIATTLMTSLPKIGNTVVWADYVHSKANGDAANDMYACVPAGAAGTVMADFYSIATDLQVNDFLSFISNMVTSISRAAQDALTAPLGAGEAAIDGISFLAAPGGPTAPHISYLGEIGGYSNLVQHAVGFLQKICLLTPVRT